jgi:hypothetical protein
MLSRGLHQVPQISIEVSEDCDGAAGLLFWLPNELDLLRLVSGVVAPEIFGVQEKKDAAPALIANT